jgi:hypothetical protein
MQWPVLYSPVWVKEPEDIHHTWTQRPQQPLQPGTVWASQLQHSQQQQQQHSIAVVARVATPTADCCCCTLPTEPLLLLCTAGTQWGRPAAAVGYISKKWEARAAVSAAAAETSLKGAHSSDNCFVLSAVVQGSDQAVAQESCGAPGEG